MNQIVNNSVADSESGVRPLKSRNEANSTLAGATSSSKQAAAASFVAAAGATASLPTSPRRNSIDHHVIPRNGNQLTEPSAFTPTGYQRMPELAAVCGKLARYLSRSLAGPALARLECLVKERKHHIPRTIVCALVVTKSRVT